MCHPSELMWCEHTIKVTLHISWIPAIVAWSSWPRKHRNPLTIRNSVAHSKSVEVTTPCESNNRVCHGRVRGSPSIHRNSRSTESIPLAIVVTHRYDTVGSAGVASFFLCLVEIERGAGETPAPLTRNHAGSEERWLARSTFRAEPSVQGGH